jgi:hypothetical protein
MAIDNKRSANIKLKEITVSSEKQPDKYYSFELSKDVPFVSFSNNLNIENENLIYLKVHNDKFLPWIELKFRDKSNRMIDELFPTDNSKVSILIQSQNENYWPIRMDFKITSFNPSNKKSGENNDIVYSALGVLDVDYLFYRNFWSFEGTSYKTLDKISKESNLGFSSNFSNTNDSMVWINPGLSFLEFVKDITEHSFKSMDTFLFSFVDFYYNLNFIDVENQLKENISEQKTFLNEVTPRLQKTNNSESKEVPLKLTNHPDYLGTSLFIDKYNIDNSSTKTNLENGYSVINQHYNITNNEYVFKDIETLSDTGNNDQIVLKDQPNQNNNLITNSKNKEYLGKIDEDNCHKNYLIAETQNKLNLDFSQKLKMVISLNQPNWGLYRFQKLNLELYKLTEVDADENAPEDNSNKLNRKLSGEWLITSINYVYYKGKGTTQTITLIKRELSANYNKRK